MDNSIHQDWGQKTKDIKDESFIQNKYSNETMAHVDDICDGDNHLEEF